MKKIFTSLNTDGWILFRWIGMVTPLDIMAESLKLATRQREARSWYAIENLLWSRNHSLED